MCVCKCVWKIQLGNALLQNVQKCRSTAEKWMEAGRWRRHFEGRAPFRLLSLLSRAHKVHLYVIRCWTKAWPHLMWKRRQFETNLTRCPGQFQEIFSYLNIFRVITQQIAPKTTLLVNCIRYVRATNFDDCVLSDRFPNTR